MFSNVPFSGGAFSADAGLTNTNFTPAVGSLTLAGIAPSVVTGQVITPTGQTVIIGSAPSVVVSGYVITPAVGSLSIVGAAPGVAQSKVITPSTGVLILVGGTVIISNPNWIPIVTTQTPNWLLVAA